jgi:hypothetical protein
MARKYKIFPLLLLVHTEKAGFTLPLESANLGLSDSEIGFTTGQKVNVKKIFNYDNFKFLSF